MSSWSWENVCLHEGAEGWNRRRIQAQLKSEISQGRKIRFIALREPGGRGSSTRSPSGQTAPQRSLCRSDRSRRPGRRSRVLDGDIAPAPQMRTDFHNIRAALGRDIKIVLLAQL